ncbi:conserved hypothetical protein, conserved [Trypanosoma brucei gambiense DAL972]|uniref:T. brucei spp.-specific protein n=1 Tax=Trypanosoma brucei gambiense (strain MHOM/CI/86/DAL972) TaxID=679716 RepID=C9ZZQ8_TRYB9|nr:conserved hypothetical protein, conserved [Trypanosoma brucei gambiense DAL972]CBH14907.1 conserved hypothetical protein, conserved [Trypanosoma brucei gambiense DAL972]|eukprot:XP_011777173.1 conserved hypothetical protein, conserved [Trypanosoma brucei gambiense DAL972]
MKAFVSLLAFSHPAIKCACLCVRLSCYSLITFHGFPSLFSYSAVLSASVPSLIRHTKQFFFAITMQIHNMPFPTNFPALLSLCSKFEICFPNSFFYVFHLASFSPVNPLLVISVFFQSNTSFSYLH